MLIGMGLSRTSTRPSTPIEDKLWHEASLVSFSSTHTNHSRMITASSALISIGQLSVILPEAYLLTSSAGIPQRKQTIHSARWPTRAGSLSSLYEHSTKTTLSAPSPERLTRSQQSSSNSTKLPRGGFGEQTNTDHRQKTRPLAKGSPWKDE